MLDKKDWPAIATACFDRGQLQNTANILGVSVADVIAIKNKPPSAPLPTASLFEVKDFEQAAHLAQRVIYFAHSRPYLGEALMLLYIANGMTSARQMVDDYEVGLAVRTFVQNLRARFPSGSIIYSVHRDTIHMTKIGRLYCSDLMKEGLRHEKTA